MILIRFKEDGKVMGVVYDAEKTFAYIDERIEMLVESLPKPDEIANKRAVMYVDPKTKGIYFNYEDEIITKE